MRPFLGEKVMTKILSLFECYTLNNQLLDQYAINAIINFCLRDNNLFRIVNEVVFVNGEDFASSASYDKVSKKIYINPNNLYKYKHVFKCNNGLIDYNMVYLINQKIIFIIFHELCHAISFNELGNNSEFINNVINYTLMLQNNNFNLYLNSHDDFPYEREADVFAYEHLLWLINRMDNRLIDDIGKKSVYYNFMKRLLSGYNFYNQNDSPLQSIVGLNNYNAILMEASQYNLDLYERLTFGFPISSFEIKQLIDYADNLIYPTSKIKCLF